MQGKTSLGIVRKYHPDVKRVVDAKKPIKITVAAADCKGAKKGSPSQCAMAKAFCRDFDGAIISKSVSYLVRGTTATRYFTPAAVSREIVSFDRHRDFRPGEYKLNVPDKKRPIGTSHSDTGGHKPNKGIKKFHHRTDGVRSL